MSTIIYSGTPSPDWFTLETVDAAAADAEIRKHLECEIIDTESIAFTCYTHSVTVRWIG